MTDVAPIAKGGEGKRGTGELVNRRWSWPEQNRKPVYNFRSEGREFTSNRCLIMADGFYEFTKPDDPKQKRKKQMALYDGRSALVLHRRHLALAPRNWRGLHNANDGRWRRHRAVPSSPDYSLDARPVGRLA